MKTVKIPVITGSEMTRQSIQPVSASIARQSSLYKTLSRMFAAFGVVMIFAVSGWGGPPASWTSNTPVISLSCTPSSLDERHAGTQLVSCEVSIDVAPNNDDLKLTIKTSDDTARTNDNDYEKLDSDFTFNKNTTTKSKTFTITINGDSAVESDETFFVNVVENNTDKQNFTLPSPPQTVTIRNDDLVLTDLSITKAVNNATPLVGENVTFTIIGRNNGPTTSDITITDTLPAGLTWVSDSDDQGNSFNCTNSGQTVTCTGTQDFASSAQVTVTIVANVVSSGTIVNTATIESANSVSESNSANNSASVTVIAGSPPVMGNIPDQNGIKNTPFTLNISGNVTRTENDSILSYALNGTLPTGLSFNTSTGTLSGTPTQTGTFSFTATATDKDGTSNADPFILTITSAATGTVPELPADSMCNLFPTPLTTFSHLTTQNNGIYNSCSISYPTGAWTDAHVGNNPRTGCHDGTPGTGCDCARVNPTSMYTAPLYITNRTDTVSLTGTNTLSDLNQPNLNLSGTITFNPSTSYSNDSRKVMLIGDMNNVNVDTMTFNEGDYYIKSWTISGNGNNKNNIKINGDVRIFIQGDFTNPGNNVDIAYVTTASTFFMYTGGDMTTSNQGGGNATWQGFYYVKGNYTNSNNANAASLKGGITAEGTLTFSGQNYSVTYDADRADRLGGQVCAAAVTVGFDTADYQTSEDINLPFESTSTILMTIRLSKAAAYDVTVAYDTQNGTAIAGQDYIAQSATVTIPRGQTSVTVPMYIIHDQPIELDETFQVVLSNPQPSGTLLGITPATVTILAQTTAPLCYKDDFNSGTATANNWRVLKSSGSYTPGYVNNRMQLTDAVGNRATAITKDYEFSASQNLIIAEFTHYAYAGDGADGIALVLYDSAVGATPTVGAFGGSLGYAQKSNPGSDCTVSGGCPGFQGGWLGLGIDEYGNYSSPTEGRLGGTGFISDAVAIRGKGSNQTGYTYLAGTTTMTPSIDTAGSTPKPGDKFRMTVDARDPAHLYISLERDTGTGNGYQFVIDKFDAIASQGASPTYVRLAFTGSTGGSNNIHEIDDLTVNGNCSPYVPSLSGAFRVTEDSSTASWSVKWPKKLIKTQVAPLINKRFCVLAGTSANESALPLTSSVAVDVNLTNYTGYNQQLVSNLMIPSGSATTCFDVNYASAAKTMQFIVGKHNDTISAKSFSDTFSIRPKNFIVETNSTTPLLVAGQTYRLDVNTTSMTSTNPVGNYDTVLGTLPNTSVLKTLAPTMITCPANGSESLSLTFTSGQASSSNFVYDNVMDIDVTVLDGNWTETDQANGGCILGSDDWTTTPVGCLIKGVKQVRFVPHHFDLTANFRNFNNEKFTYLSNPKIPGNDYNMSALLDLNITAKTALNHDATYYNSLCYAKAKDIKITYTPLFIDNLTSAWYQYGFDSTVIGDSSKNIGTDLNLTSLTPAVFSTDHNGSAQLHVKINFDRNETKQLSPFNVDITNIDVNTIDEVNAAINPPNTASFVYGRFIPRDVRVFGDTVPFSVNGWYEVFDAQTLGGTALSPSRNDPLWFVNSLHSDTSDGNATVSVVENYGALPTNGASVGGIETYNFTHYAIGGYKAHMSTSPWLWYGVNASPYVDPTGNQNCLTHPCFNISVSPVVGTSGSAKSGLESTKSSKSSTQSGSNGSWKSTSDYAPAIR
ncbi:MAG: putative Ig domain-containing protein [Sulfuricurvum sp.]|uniref:Calx-beta domain-containing protein n=1 Tax=Sulfuricurvum sp. TaxID=2025608 RepID=UPI0025ED3F5F|nr:Calx-beta domain-containing protein [Sulfuricurvum sp.]MCK9371771.1 putative Ig domain-containing protein [Sulfuricurvum sp.]